MTPARFQELDKLASAVARRLPRGGPAWEDLRQVFLVDFFRPRSTQTRAGEGLDELLGRDDAGLRAAVSNRLRQLGLEAMDDRNRFRALRQHVAAALAEPATKPKEPPLSLQAGTDRFSFQAVKQAVDWVHLERRRDWREAGVRAPAPDLDATQVTRLLLERYPLFDRGSCEPHLAHVLQEPEAHPGPVRAARHPPGNPRGKSSTSPATRARRTIDGQKLLDRLRDRLAERKLDVLRRRFRGDTFEEIARDLGVALATAHQWCQEATRQLSTLILTDDGIRLSEWTVREALETARPNATPHESVDRENKKSRG